MGLAQNCDNPKPIQSLAGAQAFEPSPAQHITTQKVRLGQAEVFGMVEISLTPAQWYC